MNKILGIVVLSLLLSVNSYSKEYGTAGMITQKCSRILEFKEKLKERLEYCLEWRRDTELYLHSKNLTDNVYHRYYLKRPLSKFLLNIYFLPINILKFIRYLKIKKNLEINAIEIDYIYDQLENSEENNEKK